MYTDFLLFFFFLSFLSSEYQLDALSAQFSIVAIDLRLFMTQRVFLEVSHVLAYLVTLQDSPGGTITQSSLSTKKTNKICVLLIWRQSLHHRDGEIMCLWFAFPYAALIQANVSWSSCHLFYFSLLLNYLSFTCSFLKLAQNCFSFLGLCQE